MTVRDVREKFGDMVGMAALRMGAGRIARAGAAAIAFLALVGCTDSGKFEIVTENPGKFAQVRIDGSPLYRVSVHCPGERKTTHLSTRVSVGNYNFVTFWDLRDGMPVRTNCPTRIDAIVKNPGDIVQFDPKTGTLSISGVAKGGLEGIVPNRTVPDARHAPAPTGNPAPAFSVRPTSSTLSIPPLKELIRNGNGGRINIINNIGHGNVLIDNAEEPAGEGN